MSARVMFWGTSSTRPFKGRLPPCTLVKLGEQLLVFDAGELCQGAFEYFGLSYNSPLTILVSHLHGDHVYGLLPLLETLQLAGRSRPVRVIGPPGLNEIMPLRGVLQRSILVETVELTGSEGKLTIGGVERATITYIRAPHTPSSYSYVLETSEKVKLDSNKLAEKAIPERLRRRLVEEGAVVVNGRTYTIEEFVLDKIPGVKISYSGDTLPSARFASKSLGADIMIHEGTLLTSDWRNRELVAHTTPRDAAYLARLARVKLLVLTHFSTRYEENSPLLEEAKEVFPRVVLAEKGLIIEVEARKPRVIRVYRPWLHTYSY